MRRGITRCSQIRQIIKRTVAAPKPMVPFFSRNFCDNGRYAFSAVVLLSAGNILPLMGLFDGAAYSRAPGRRCSVRVYQVANMFGSLTARLLAIIKGQRKHSRKSLDRLAQSGGKKRRE